MSLRQRTGGSTNPNVFTSADLIIDEGLSNIDRVCQYTSASVALMRLVHVSMISDVAHDVGYDTMVDRLFPLLPKLCDDDEWVVRNKVAPEIATMCQLSIAFGAGKGYDLVVSQLLPLLAKLAGDVHADVRASGARALAGISIMLKPDDLAVHLFTIVIELANAESNSGTGSGVFNTMTEMDDAENDTAEDLRMAATELMELLAPHLGEELCEQFLVPTIQNLAEDDSFRVRKAVALHLSDIIRTCTCEVREDRLLPMFLMLAYDEIWGVRKAVAESMMEVSLALDADERTGLIRTMCTLLEDDEHWVSWVFFRVKTLVPVVGGRCQSNKIRRLTRLCSSPSFSLLFVFFVSMTTLSHLFQVSDTAYEYLGRFLTTLPPECLTLSSASSNKDNIKLLSLYKDSAHWTADMREDRGRDGEDSEGSGKGSGGGYGSRGRGGRGNGGNGGNGGKGGKGGKGGDSASNDHDRVYW